MKKKLFAFLILFMSSICMVSCGDDEPKSNTTKDPAGTIILSVMLKSDYSISGNESSYWFYLDSGYNLDPSSGDIAVIGPVKGISSITMNNIPQSGWNEEAAAIVGYGYVLRYSTGNNKYHYAALYVDSEIESTSGGIMGYIMKALPLNY